MKEIEELKKLKSLFDQGAISEEEFIALKKKMLLSMGLASKSDSEKRVTQPEIKVEPVKVKSRVVPDPKFENVEQPQEYETGNETTINLFKIAIGLIFLLSIATSVFFNSLIAFVLALAVSIYIFYTILKKTLELKKRNLRLGLMNLSYFVLMIIFFSADNSFSGSGSSNTSSSQFVSEEGENTEVREFLINNIFVNEGNGGMAILNFDGSRYGWHGLVTITFGGCDFIYEYETQGNRVDLNFSYTFCSGFSGSRATVRVNINNNSLTLVFQGQELIFRPL